MLCSNYIMLIIPLVAFSKQQINPKPVLSSSRHRIYPILTNVLVLNGESRERSWKLNIVANHEGNTLNPQLSVGWQSYSGNSIQLALKKNAYIE
jgi:hypothetical protein